MQIRAIHQFSPSCSAGDGVTNGMLFTQRLLRSMGFESEIYCVRIANRLTHQVKPLSALRPDASQLMLLHFSLGFDEVEWLHQMTMPKIMVYHNITPPELLPAEGPLRRLAALGRTQLASWPQRFVGAIGVSEINSEELRAAGYRNVQTIPMLVDIEKLRNASVDAEACSGLENMLNLLFVGRICENKHQLELLDVLHEYTLLAEQPVRLILAGGVTSDAYLEKIKARSKAMGLENNVLLCGKVSDAHLMALYRQADAFVSLSEHEGFGMPLIEAMLFDVPVVAYSTPGIADTMGAGGLLLESDAPAAMAATLHLLFSEPALKRRVISAQRDNVERFDVSSVRSRLADYLNAWVAKGTPAAVVAAAAAGRESQIADTAGKQASEQWQVEGPFDSSYSLAIVNRELARALAADGVDVSLRSLESGRDTAPDAGFLGGDPASMALYKKRAQATRTPDVSLRFCYPPHVSNMSGGMRLMHSYGWEETGFPRDYVYAFNRKLDGITVLSEFVKKILQDNGVRIPIAVTGGGVDHLLRIKPQAPDAALQMKGYRFLHVSSCFPRKGVDALLAAYGQAFRAQDDVTLVIKTFPNRHNTVAEQLAALRSADSAFPDVLVINEDYQPAALAGLYRACHAFVAPSRGEGLGLPMAEAMLFDLPVITTAWGGQRDFCNERTAWLCDYRFARAATHLATGHSVWADPVVEDLAQRLRDVYEASPAERALRTAAARKLVAEEYTWARVAQRVKQAVAAIRQQPLWRQEPHIAWVSTLNTRCGIAAYSSFLTTAIPADRITVLADRSDDLSVPDGANVIRCWSQGQQEPMQQALEAIAASGASAVVIQYNFGFYSIETLGRLVTVLHQRGINVYCFLHATADPESANIKGSLRDIAAGLALCARVVVHGVDDLNRLKSYGLVDNVTLFPQGVLATPPRSAEQARNALGLQGKTVIAAYGFLLPHKGLQVLIRAFSSLAAQDASRHLLLVNALYPNPVSDEEERACRALIEEFQLQDRVTFQTAFLSDAESLAHLQAAALIVYPYQDTRESSSAAVRMALAAGRPVAVTPLDIFNDVEDAVHRLPGCDAEAIALGITALLADTDVIREKQLSAQRWIAARQWPQLSVRLLGLIDGVANALEISDRPV